MNNKAQAGALAFIFGIIVFFIAWVLVLAEQIRYWGQDAIVTNSMTGVSAFLIGNINLWIALFMAIALIWFLFAGSNQ